MMSETRPILYLIDISSYIYRAYHALPGLRTSQGLPTNAVFGVTNMLLKVLRERQPVYLALAFDTKGPTFRHQRYPVYKAQRPPMPDDLATQLPYIQRLVAALNLPALEQEGYEADDIICTLTKKARAAGLQVEIISGDKDLFPLIEEGVTVWDPMKDKRYDLDTIKEKYGVEPCQLVDVRGLAGDASDNIPGVPGVGEKTALQLISQFHDLNNLFGHLGEINKKKLKANLVEFRDQALLSRELSVLDSQVPLEVSLEELKPGPWDRQALRRMFAELEFSKLSKELGAENNTGNYSLVTDRESLQEVVDQIARAGRVAVFFLTSEQHPMLAEIAGLALSWEEGGGVYLPWQGQPAAWIWELLGSIWTDPQISKIGPDLKAALLVGERYGRHLAGLAGDILLASYLLNPARYEQTLENVALHYLGSSLPGPRELAGHPLAASDLPQELALTYAVQRADTALGLWPQLQAELDREGLWPLYETLELPLLPVLAEMEAQGIGLDQEFLHRFGRDLERDLERLEEEIYALAGEAFLIQSPQQLAHILFEKLQLPPQKKTRGKTAYSTDIEVLNSLKEVHPIVAKVVEYRTLMKIKATYVDSLLKQVNPATGRIHTTFVQSVAATGRLSSRDPNLQNIPVRGEFGSQVRQAFVAGPGQVFLSGDYSQVELRILAHFSEDPAFLKAFQEGIDIHRQTAAEVFDLHPELVSPDMRRLAKVINFGIIYGMSAYGLARQLGVGQRLAQDFIDRYFERHGGVQRYIRQTLETARQQGWVATLWGRRRQIPQIRSSNRIVRQEAERRAINTPIQGTAADLIKKAMLAVAAVWRREKLAGHLLLQLHDELLLEIPEEEISISAQLLRQTMEGVAQLKVPLTVDIQLGKNWGEMRPSLMKS
ncbi:MAG: DNA polymerase I [Deltaproteobacteria bacterium]|nr:DNA polymerase I [Deltaproteobacteria bacterium]